MGHLACKQILHTMWFFWVAQVLLVRIVDKNWSALLWRMMNDPLQQYGALVTASFDLIFLMSNFQGVEFFDEKLNSLCMTWLVDHGKFALS